MSDYKNGFKPVTHDQLEAGDIFYIDNYKDGKFPKASPMISGPFLKITGNGCGRCFRNISGREGMHYPNNLLVLVWPITRHQARLQAKLRGAVVTRVAMIEQTVYTYERGWHTAKQPWRYIEYFFDKDDKEVGYYCEPTSTIMWIKREWDKTLLHEHHQIDTHLDDYH